ncbi:MAG: DUF5615 family PIN-like protein [Verrucomicrobia bacterium]|nr:DUF5615 family PIN-like protein [Verrucomicrobiota bacterium]
MPADIKLLIDEDTHLALAGALRGRGYDAVHVREAERRGLDDLSQLAFAVQQGRCFLTFNVGEFVVLHGQFLRAGRGHFGVIVSAQKPVGRLLRETLAFLQSHSADETRSQLFFL